MRKWSVIILKFNKATRFNDNGRFNVYIFFRYIFKINKCNSLTTSKNFQWRTVFVQFFHLPSGNICAFGTY